MIFKSFLSGFMAYVLAVAYSLVRRNTLKVVFFTGIKYLFVVTIIAFIFQLIFLYFSSQTAANAEEETNKTEQEAKKAEKDEKAEEIENQETTKDEFTEDFSPLNPPEIEYEE